MESRYTIPDKFIKIANPESGVLVKIERTILRTKRDCNAKIGRIRWVDNVDGSKHIDFSDLTDLSGGEVMDYPAGMEVILLNCNWNYPEVPVKFHHPEIENDPKWGKGILGANISCAWIAKTDLEHVSGNIGEKEL